MSSNLVIVAIPARDEKVWKVSSEKVPHLTLLFLGENTEDVPKLDRIVEFVEHTVKSSQHGPCMLDVEERGTLGEDDADVLFFEKGYSIKWLKEFRNRLLQHNDIRTAFDSVDQYPEWLPHLTLGYPETPANEDEVPDHGLNWITFDRIAVWTGDSEGPEFKLKWPEHEAEESLYLSSINDQRKALGLDAMLEHFGVKGMKWGVRKSPSVIEKPKSAMTTNQKVALASFGVAALTNKGVREAYQKDVASNKAFQQDKKWEKDFKKAKSFGFDDEGFTKEYNAKWKDNDFSNEDFANPSPTYKKYQDGYFSEMASSYSKQFADHYGESPSGKYEARVDAGSNQVRIQRKDAATHSLEDGVLVAFYIVRDEKGFISKLEPVEDSMAQTAARGAEALEHFGVKGMKWGIRKEKLASGAKSAGKAAGAALTVAADIQFENMAEDGRAASRIESKATGAFYRTDLPKINAKPEYQAARKLRTRLRHPRDPIVKQYRQEVKTTYIKRLEEAANLETNVSGTRQYTIRERGWELPPEGGDLPTSKHFYEVSTRDIVHAGADNKPFYVELTIDRDGFVTDLKPVDLEKSVEQTVGLGVEFLQHYGIKGMKWGVRRNGNPRDVQTTEKISLFRGKTKVEADGGQYLSASPDAVRAAVAKQKLKKSGTAALSNRELQELQTRLNLEQNVSRLTAPKGKKFVTNLLTDTAKSEGQAKVREGVKKVKAAKS